MGFAAFFSFFVRTPFHMFGLPESRPTPSGARYYVSLRSPKPLGLRVSLTAPGVLVADMAHAPAFKSFQQSILSDLVHHKQLFKTTPSLESLQALSPPFGPVLSGATTLFTPTTTFQHDPRLPTPSFVDLVLEGLYVSRSLIAPVFSTRFLESAAAAAELDLADDGLEEVDDVPDAGGETNVVLLTDPAVTAKERASRKQSVKEAFLLATAAQERAEERARAFLEDYDLSDNESGFSEFMSEDSEGEESEGEESS